MVDSSRLPPSQITKPAAAPNMLAEQSARIVNLPDSLLTVARAQRVEGEVVRQNQDGSVRVKTPQGDIDIQVRGRQPQPGQQLELDIPAGRPPRQLTIRPAQAAPQQPDMPQTRPAPNMPNTAPPIATRPAAPAPTTNPTSTNAPASGATTTANAPRPAAPAPQPLPDNAASARPAPQPVPLPVGAAVRFTPVTPAQAQQMVQTVSQMMTTLPTTATRVAFTANLIAQNAASENMQALQTAMQTKPADINNLAQQLRAPALTLPQPGAGLTAAPAATLLQQILNMQPALTQTAGTITHISANATAAPAVLPASSGAVASPLATLLAAIPDADGVMPTTTGAARMIQIAQMDARIITIQPPATALSASGTPQGLPVPGATHIPAPSAMPGAPAGSVTGVVTGFTPQNLPLVTVQWPGASLPQTFVLQFNASNLPVGTTITFQPQNVQPGMPGAGAAAPLTPQMQQLLNLFGPGPWPVMDEAYQTLLQVSPQAAQALARSLPSPGAPSQLGAAALLFIAAVRSGDIGGWLGDKKIDALARAGKNNLLSRLTQDLSTLAQRTSDAPALANDWRPVPLPMFWEGQIQKIALYVKQDGGGKGDSDKNENGHTRFIFDLDLDRMGGVQLDGLVRNDRFDLVVRTQLPLSNAMQQAMKQSYSNALQSTELHGDLSFQGDIKNWVNVLQKEAAFGASA